MRLQLFSHYSSIRALLLGAVAAASLIAPVHNVALGVQIDQQPEENGIGLSQVDTEGQSEFFNRIARLFAPRNQPPPPPKKCPQPTKASLKRQIDKETAKMLKKQRCKEHKKKCQLARKYAAKIKRDKAEGPKAAGDRLPPVPPPRIIKAPMPPDMQGFGSMMPSNMHPAAD